ncbi:N-succinylarginine dihydrolase [Sneathiella chinensis]|uniref:N-succinylarginine dihydrolase n=1 Tax=Sneathiella chinensis TaxID=349750 RepID=A0ABQ5TZY6_9PROT|nr:N-succinylarginine dihydrolase [Sneathiella chinensis]GLQ05437.1 N-succinylarginine dihydrolase [Sneathiella chinensis]
MTIYYEANFDGLVGPTHNFAGLSHGNLASTGNALEISNPRQAALQGLEKMHSLMKMGLRQGILPPHERPHLPTLRALGYQGSDAHIIALVQKTAPHLLAAVSSASSMWVANAATVSPAPDTLDGRTHFTPANLASMFHRSLEPQVTGRMLSRIFEDETYFVHHPALPGTAHFSDEGAANHTRLCASYGEPGVELFVFGGSAFDSRLPHPDRFPARQTLEASRAVARLHGLTDEHALFVQQNPEVIDKGVFHNDVIAVGNGPCLFYHQDAFLNPEQLQRDLQARLHGTSLHFIEVPRSEVSVADAVQSYLFNSQLVSLDETRQTMHLIAPLECRENHHVHRYLEKLLTRGTPVQSVTYLDIRQSMKNGGGPACLRLRVVLSEEAGHSIAPRVFLTDTLYEDLKSWIMTHYRDRLSPDDLKDPDLLVGSQQALDELTSLLGLGAVYDFQLG